MRVYFVGAHSVGKTTLARYISRRYKLPMISEVARAVLAEMETSFTTMRTDLDKVAVYQREVFSRQVAAEEQAGESFVSDRAFDNVAYAAEHTLIAYQILESPKFRDYMKWVAKGRIFFIRPQRALLKDDGTREHTYWESVVRMDAMVKFLLEQHQVAYIPMRLVEAVLAAC
jgi:predicted ATPase